MSDYGLADEFVAVCKAVIGRIAPHATILDITHLVRPFAIREAAVVLARAVPFLPGSVHLAVVDPGVGSPRRPIALGTSEGSVLVGPDNGLLLPAAAELGGAWECREIANRGLMLPAISSTFHGRDLFAPVAAHLASGVELSELGPKLAIESLVEVPSPVDRLHGDHVHAEVLHVDAFGNLQLSVRPSRLQEIAVGQGAPVEVRFSYLWVTAPLSPAFADVGEGEWVLTEDSSGWLSLSINRGSAGLTMKAEAGDEVALGPVGFRCRELDGG